VDGQQVTEFTATVEPFRLIKGLSETALEFIRKQLPLEKLEVFITESGLPVRVVTSTSIAASPVSQTTEILAINIPVKVKRPPARRTISTARLLKLAPGKDELTVGGVIETKSSSGPTTITIPPPPSVVRAGGRQLAEFKQGRMVTAQSGCLACHRIGSDGNAGPGPVLTHIGSKLSKQGSSAGTWSSRGRSRSMRRSDRALPSSRDRSCRANSCI